MYEAIGRMAPARQLIILLVAETGSVGEVARRLKMPKTTVWRVYDGIRKEVRQWCGV